MHKGGETGSFMISDILKPALLTPLGPSSQDPIKATGCDRLEADQGIFRATAGLEHDTGIKLAMPAGTLQVYFSFVHECWE